MSRSPSPRRSLALLLLAFALLAIAATGCRRLASPEGWASPILHNDVLLAANRDNLFAFDVNEEPPSPLWKFPLPAASDEDEFDPKALYGTPGAEGKTVFIPAYNNVLYAVDIESGEVSWPFETDGKLVGGVATSGSGVYFGSSDGKLYGLAADSGEQLWQPFQTGKEIWSTPVLADGALYVTSLDSRLYVLDPADGTELWSFKAGGALASPPVVDPSSGLVILGGFDTRLRAVDLDTHEEVWSVTADNWFWTAPIIANGVVYAGALDGMVYAVDIDTGEPHWPQPFETDAPVRAAPVIAGGNLIIADTDGNVYAIDPNEGVSTQSSLVLDQDVFADPLVLPDGDEVIIVTHKGDIVDIDPSTLTVTGRRPLKQN